MLVSVDLGLAHVPLKLAQVRLCLPQPRPARLPVPPATRLLHSMLPRERDDEKQLDGSTGLLVDLLKPENCFQLIGPQKTLYRSVLTALQAHAKYIASLRSSEEPEKPEEPLPPKKKVKTSKTAGGKPEPPARTPSILIVQGPVGCGKYSVVRLALRECNLREVWFEPDGPERTRNRAKLQSYLDCVEPLGIVLRSTSVGAADLIKFLRSSSRRDHNVVILLENEYLPGFSAFCAGRLYAYAVPGQDISGLKMLVNRARERGHRQIELHAVSRVADQLSVWLNNHGDLRRAINNLHVVGVGEQKPVPATGPSPARKVVATDDVRETHNLRALETRDELFDYVCHGQMAAEFVVLSKSALTASGKRAQFFGKLCFEVEPWLGEMESFLHLNALQVIMHTGRGFGGVGPLRTLGESDEERVSHLLDLLSDTATAGADSRLATLMSANRAHDTFLLIASFYAGTCLALAVRDYNERAVREIFSVTSMWDSINANLPRGLSPLPHNTIITGTPDRIRFKVKDIQPQAQANAKAKAKATLNLPNAAPCCAHALDPAENKLRAAPNATHWLCQKVFAAAVYLPNHLIMCCQCYECPDYDRLVAAYRYCALCARLNAQPEEPP